MNETSSNILLNALGQITFGDVEVVRRRFGLSDNDTGKTEDIRNSLIVANDYIKKYLGNHGYCQLPCTCSITMDSIANDYALSKLYLDTINFNDVDMASNKSSRYKLEAQEGLDMFIQNDKATCVDVSNPYGVTISNQKRQCLKHTLYDKHYIW